MNIHVIFSRHITIGKLNGVAAIFKEKRYTKSFFVEFVITAQASASGMAIHEKVSVGDDLQVHPSVSCWNNDGCPLQ